MFAQQACSETWTEFIKKLGSKTSSYILNPKIYYKNERIFVDASVLEINLC